MNLRITETETNLEDRGKQKQNKTEHKSACCKTVASDLTHNFAVPERERNEGQRCTMNKVPSKFQIW